MMSEHIIKAFITEISNGEDIPTFHSVPRFHGGVVGIFETGLTNSFEAFYYMDIEGILEYYEVLKEYKAWNPYNDV